MNTALTLALIAVLANGPTLIAHGWRALRGKPHAPVVLGFDGPVLCNVVTLLVTWAPPFPWYVLLVPWALHAGTWIAATRLVQRLRAHGRRGDGAGPGPEA